MNFRTYRLILGLLLVLGGLVFSFFSIQAKERIRPTEAEPCPEPIYCIMPAPTVVQPSQNFAYSESQPLITGLSWNETHVDVYIDDVYSGRAIMRKDPSEVGNFYYRPAATLSTGEHTMYTVSRSINERARSPQSETIFFTTIILPQAPAAIPVIAPESVTTSPEMVEIIDTEDNIKEDSANSILDSFFNQGDDNASMETTTATSLSSRTIPRIIVVAFLFFIFMLATRALRRMRSSASLKRSEDNETSESSKDELPPPPL